MTAAREHRWAPVGRAVVTVAVLGVILSTVVLVSCAPDWKSSLATWEVDGEDYRLRLTGGFGTECVVVEHEDRNSRVGPWIGQGLDCAWARVAGGDGWLAGGGRVRVGEQKWLFFGIVPTAATEVVLSMAGRTARRIPTRAAGGGDNRVYADLVAGPADVTGVALHDARGKALHVY